MRTRVLLVLTLASAAFAPHTVAHADYCSKQEIPGVDLCYFDAGFRYRDHAPSTVYVLCRDDSTTNGPHAFIVDIGSRTLHYETSDLPSEVYAACAQVGATLLAWFPNGMPVECREDKDLPGRPPVDCHPR